MARAFGLGKESTYGTAVAPDIWLELLNEGIQLEPSHTQIKTIRSPTVRQLAKNGEVVRGPFTLQANYEDLHYLAYYLLGSIKTTGVGPYTHESPGDNGMKTRPSVTAEIQRDEADGGDTWKYKGCVITSLSVSAGLEEPMQIEGAVVGQAEELTAASSDTYPAFELVTPDHITVEFDDVALDAESFSLNLTHNVDEPRKLGSLTLAVQPKDSDTLIVEGEVTVLWGTDEATAYTDFTANNDVKIELVCNNGAGETVDFLISKAKLKQGTPHVDGRNRLKSTFTFEGYFDTTDTGAIQITTVNNDANPVTDD